MGVRGLCVFILSRPRKNEPRKRTKGLCPLETRAAVGGATVRLADKARLKDLGKC